MAVEIMKAALLASTLGLGVGFGLGVGISRSAAQGIAMDVAYVEAVSGRVVASSQGKPTLLDVLDTIGDWTQLDLQANSELRICHYRTHKLLTLSGPLRALVSVSGVTAENGTAIDGQTETCAAPVVSTFQGGLVARALTREQIAKLDPLPPVKPVARLDDPAIKELEKTIQLNPDDGRAFYKRGQLYAKNGDFARAITDFDAAIRFDPKDAEALNNRCWARAIVGELQTALKDCNEALQIRPRYADAFDSRGFVNLKIGQPVKALADYDEALRINPKLASSLYGRGIAKVRSGNAASANADIAAANAIHPNIAEEFADHGVR
jgi:tetratricopeptide (TPR) repeat protein